VSCTGSNVQSLILLRPQATDVAHVIVTVPRDKGGQPRTRDVLHLLKQAASPSFGLQNACGLFCSLGFTRTGLTMLGVPVEYRQIFLELAPEYFEGAARRLDRLGDTVGGGNPSGPWPELAPTSADAAHVVISWHGSKALVDESVERFLAHWQECLHLNPPDVRRGHTLPGPNGAPGNWLHFGYRDGISEIRLTGINVQDQALDPREHALGELLLGYPDDEGVNTFALVPAYAKVRVFFRDSSFGVLRPMSQDVEAFDDWIKRTVAYGRTQLDDRVTPDFVRAKLCGRWPTGEAIRPLKSAPVPNDFKIDFTEDTLGTGCPFSAHVRRLQGKADRSGPAIARPLQRRSLPFGEPASGEPRSDGIENNAERGLIGHFFCASIAVQFEHLMGQWIARAPLDRPPEDQAADPLTGPRDVNGGSMAVPIENHADLSFTGFGDWTRPLGTLYAWYPGIEGWNALLEGTYDVDKEVWRGAAAGERGQPPAAAVDRRASR
jgi:hypothetical protein